MTCRYYGHTAYGRYLNNLVAVERHMDKRGLVAACDLPLGRSLFMPLTQLYKCVADLLLADPYVLVTPVSENQ